MSIIISILKQPRSFVTHCVSFRFGEMRSRLDTHDLGDRFTINACRDRKDDNFLEIVVNRKSDYLITADCDLLGFHPFHNIPILAPIEFISLLMLRGSFQDPHP